MLDLEVTTMVYQGVVRQSYSYELLFSRWLEDYDTYCTDYF